MKDNTLIEVSHILEFMAAHGVQVLLSQELRQEMQLREYPALSEVAQEEFPKGICATLKGDAAHDFALTEGRKVRVFFEPRVNQSKASGKWFTSCHAWRIDPL